MSLKLHFFSCDSNGEKHLSANGATNTRTSTFIFTDVKIQLALTTELHSQVPSSITNVE